MTRHRPDRKRWRRSSQGKEGPSPSGTEAKGGLYVVATPIGNMEDLSARARRVLSEVDLVASEDTRTVGRFLKRLGIHARQVSFFEGNEEKRTPELVALLAQGSSIGLVTEAGTPTLSDPGERLVQAAVEGGFSVTAVPGPCAAVAALSVSGLPTQRFLFEGFLPSRGSARRKRVEELASVTATLVLYESPRRLRTLLLELAPALGPDRRAAVCRELTKLHEEVVRGTLAELCQRYERAEVRGEVTLVVEGSSGPGSREPPEEIDERIGELLAQGLSARSIASEMSGKKGISRNEIYRRTLEIMGKEAASGEGTAAAEGEEGEAKREEGSERGRGS